MKSGKKIKIFFPKVPPSKNFYKKFQIGAPGVGLDFPNLSRVQA
jgi:hypothetical protein